MAKLMRSSTCQQILQGIFGEEAESVGRLSLYSVFNESLIHVHVEGSNCASLPGDQI